MFMPIPIMRCDEAGDLINVNARHERGFDPPRAWLHEERKMRHELGWLLGYQHTEAGFYREGMALGRYVALPDGWLEWEVPYLLAMPMPTIVSYFKDHLVSDNLQDYPWHVFLSQWAANCLISAYGYALEGSPTWVPDAVRRAWRVMGVDQILQGCPPMVVERCQELHEVIERVRWFDVPAQNRHLLNEVGSVTPVYGGGELVPFDPDNWRPVLLQAVLAVEIPTSQEDRVSERVDRGPYVFGKTEGWISVQNPRVGELDVTSQFLRGRPEDITRADVVRLNRITQSYFDKYGYSTLARRHGLNTMEIDGVMQFVVQCLFRLNPEDPAWAAGSAYRDPLWGTADDMAQSAAGSGDTFGEASSAPGPSAGHWTGGE